MNLIDNIAIIMLIGIIFTYVFFLVIIVTGHLENMELNYFYPSELFKHTILNKVSCIFVSIVLILINYLYVIVYFIFTFIYFITHVGRKEKKDDDK